MAQSGSRPHFLSAVPLLSIVSYNPMSVRQPGRIDDIHSRFHRASFLCLQGTREPAFDHPVQEFKDKHFVRIVAGYDRKGNKHAGVSVSVSRRRFRRKQVHHIAWPTDKQISGLTRVSASSAEAHIQQAMNLASRSAWSSQECTKPTRHTVQHSLITQRWERVPFISIVFGSQLSSTSHIGKRVVELHRAHRHQRGFLQECQTRPIR